MNFCVVEPILSDRNLGHIVTVFQYNFLSIQVAPKVPVIPTGLEYKVIFVGDAAVGKSSLIRKISRGTFSSHRDPTASMCFSEL